MKIGLLNGPNLDLLGKREPDIYGSFTIADIESKLQSLTTVGMEMVSYQSNGEGELIDFIHRAVQRENIEYLIFNPGAYTHTSIAIRDAIAGTGIKVIEVHISNIYKREDFRHKSVIAPVCIGQISGFGMDSYILAFQYILSIMNSK